MELLVGDVDYILTQLRKISYGTHIPVNYECECAENEEDQKKRTEAGGNEYLVPVDHFILNTKELTVKDFNKNFKVDLRNGQHVTLQPVRFSDFVKIQHMEDPNQMKDIEDVKEYVAINFAAITAAVDEITNKDDIKEWYKELPRLETERIKNKLTSVGEWGMEFKYSIVCKACKEKKELKTQLNPMYFFMLPSSPETKS